MNESRYLKDESYYTDLYDLHTIEEYLDYYWSIKDGFEKNRSNKEFKKFTKEEFDKEVHKIASYTINVIKGERYRNKATTIKKWMEADRNRQEFYDNVPEPSNIHCENCGRQLYSDMKLLEDYENKPLRVLFYFPCKTCKKKRAFYHTGEEHVSKPPHCPKCNSLVEEKHTIKNKGKVILWIKTCPSCGFSEKEVDGFEKNRNEWKKKEEKDKELLAKYREEFCLSEKDGQDYIYRIGMISKIVDEHKEREKNKEIYDQIAKLKKLTIVELEKLLGKKLEKEQEGDWQKIDERSFKGIPDESGRPLARFESKGSSQAIDESLQTLRGMSKEVVKAFGSSNKSLS